MHVHTCVCTCMCIIHDIFCVCMFEYSECAIVWGIDVAFLICLVRNSVSGEVRCVLKTLNLMLVLVYSKTV